MTLEDFSYWARGQGLEAALVVLGAILVARAIHSVCNLYARRLQRLPADELLERTRHQRVLVQVVDRAIVAGLAVVAALVVLSKLNVPTTTLIAPATVIGAAIGFGSQRLVADFLSGFFLTTEKQFGFGDVVQISAPGQSDGVAGSVEELTLRYTRLRTQNGEVLTIPNGEVRQVLNKSQGWSRVDINVPVPSGANIEQVTDALRSSVLALGDDDHWKSLLLDAPVVAGIEEFDLDRIDLRVSARTRPLAAGTVARELRRRAAMVVGVAGGGSSA